MSCLSSSISILRPFLRTSISPSRRYSTMAQTIYIVSAIHCPSPDGINPHCYSITGAYSSASAAHAAMLAKAKELCCSPITHSHGTPRIRKEKEEWKEGPFKVEFTGKAGDFGVCWVDERVLGNEVVPITSVLRHGRFGMAREEGVEADTDEEIEMTLSGILRYS